MRRPQLARSIEVLVLALIMAVTVFWRFYELDYRSLWYDEVGVARVAAQDTLWAVIRGARSHMSAPPADYILRHFWQQSFGIGDISLRAYTAIWGCVGVLLSYLLGRAIYGPVVGLLAAFLMAISDYHVHYSAEIKFYALSIVAYLAILYTWIRARRDSTRVRGIVVFGLTGILGVYTHAYAVFAVGFCALTSLAQWVMCILDKRGSRSCARSLGLVAVATAAIATYVPWVIWDFLQQPAGWAAPSISLATAGAILDELVPAGRIGLAVVLIGGSYAVAMTIAGRHRASFADQVPVWLTVAIAPLLVWLLDVMGHYPFLSKQLVVVQPLLLMVAASGLRDLYETLHQRIDLRWGSFKVTPLGVGAVIVILLIFNLSWVELTEEKRSDNWLLFNYQQVVGWLHQHTKPTDLVVWTERNRSHTVEWYLDQMSLTEQSVGLEKTWGQTSANFDEVQAIVKQHTQGEVWLFGPEIDQILDGNNIADLFLATTIGNVRIYRISNPRTWNHEFIPPLIPAQTARYDLQKTVFLLSNNAYKLQYILDDPQNPNCKLELVAATSSSANDGATITPDHDMLLIDSDPAAAGEYGLILNSPCLPRVQTASLVRVPAVDTDHPIKIDDGLMAPRGAARHRVDSTGRTLTWHYKSGDAVSAAVYVRVPGRYRIVVHGLSYGAASSTANVFINRMIMGQLEFGKNWTSAEIHAEFSQIGTHTMQLVFATDNGRNDLAVDWVELAYVSADFEPVITLDLATLAASYHGGVEVSSSGELGMFWAGRAAAEYMVEPGLYTLRVQARGQQGCQLWPVLHIDVDGTGVASQAIDSNSTEVYEFPNLSFSEGDRHMFGLRFEQPGECTVPGQDVNLFIQGLYLSHTGDAPANTPIPAATPDTRATPAAGQPPAYASYTHLKPKLSGADYSRRTRQ